MRRQLPTNISLDRPKTPRDGEMYYDAADDAIMYWTGDAWAVVLTHPSTLLQDWVWETQGPNEWVVKVVCDDWYDENRRELFDLISNSFTDLNGTTYIRLKNAECSTYFELKWG